MDLKIDELAELTGVTERDINEYVTKGLLAPPRAGGTYDAEHYEALEVIKRLQTEGLSQREIRERLGVVVAGSTQSEATAGSANGTDGPSPDAPEADPVPSPPTSAATMKAAPRAQPSHAGPPAPESTGEPRRVMRIALTVAILVIAAAALVVAAIALRDSRDADKSQAAPTYALPDACAFFTGYANSLALLSANVLGPSPYRQFTDAELGEFLARVDQALTLREKACVTK